MNDPTKHLPPALQKSIDWRFMSGDLRQRVGEVLKKEPAHSPDYLFLDSYHSKAFAKYYTDELFRLWPQKHMFVSLHDVYNPSFWADDVSGRNLEHHPAWMPNEEGLLVLDWLVYQMPSTLVPPSSSSSLQQQPKERILPVCNIHTIAKARFPYLVERFAEMRASVLGQSEKKSINPLYVGMDVDAMWDPTVFWETGCRI
ncbi:hypothetical protein HDV05_004577 [Chytridiales sp. JEL 0842]|nr:hypothetical protein HDV05_004577 [Chytridiales sp. JEL 0842]